MSDSESDSETETLRKSRCRRRVVVTLGSKGSKSGEGSSNSSSDDSASSSFDGSVIGKRKNRKQNRMISTSEEDDSGSEPLVIEFAAAKKMLYEGVDSDSSWSPSSEPVASTSSGRFRVSNSSVTPSTSAAAAAPVAGPSSGMAVDEAAGFSSDTSNDASEKCPICLHSFRDQEIGTPNTCDHTYCRICIEEWSRNVQTCPIDRQQFASITVRTRYENGRFVRSIPVEASGTELEVDDEDLTQCEVCNDTDREDRMLLCDGCNKGFHMDCLSPPLHEIPESSWYCDYCFDSDATSDDENDLNQLITEMEMEVGVPETRFRVRRVEDTPRITRTRQSERIRATIMSRIEPTRRTAGTATAERNADVNVAGPSRRISTYTRTTTRTRTTTTRSSRKRRVRKSKRSSRTYVVEYDVEGGSKFPMTTKKVIKRKRKSVKGKRSKRKTSGRRCGTRSSRSTATRNDESAASVGGSGTRGSGGAYPSLHLFGNPNTFDYFSDDEAMDLSDENAGRGLGGHDGGAIMSATLTRTRIGSTTLRRQKRIISALDSRSGPSAGAADVLSNIMDTMDRWHEMTQPRSLEKIKIDNDGKLTFDGKSSKPAKDKKSDIESSVQNAPVYPRSGGGAGVGGYNNQNNNNFQRSGSYQGGRGGGGNANNGQNGGNNSNNTTPSSGMSFNIFGPRNTNASNPGGSGGNGPNNNQFNEFPSNRFPPNTPNRRNQPQNQQANNNFRNLNASPFNQSPQFPNRNFGANNNFANNAQPTHGGGGGGLYDDPQMPPPVANSSSMINSLQMQTPPPHIPPTNVALQQLHMSTPPPLFHPAMNIVPPMMAHPPPFVAPQFVAPPPMNMFSDSHTIAAPYPQPTETAHTSAAEQYDPTVDSEGPDQVEAEQEENALDIPLPTVAPATSSSSKPSAGLSGLANYGSDDDENDCPNFSVYSTVSMNVARNIETDDLVVYGPENKPESDNDGLEHDEDLVQLDDDDEEDNVEEAVEEAVDTQKETTSTAEEDVDKDKSLMKKNVLDLHDDSDWEELNNEKSDESAVSKGKDDDADAKSTHGEEHGGHHDRSYTPCLDEQVPGCSDKSGEIDPDAKSDDNEDKSDDDDDDEANRAGIAGMETELISDDEAEDILNGKLPADRTKSNRDKSGKTSKKTADKRKDTDDPKKRDDKDKSKNRKSDKEESFKKISRSNKDRNYRDKNYDKRRRRRSSSRSRSRSNNKENRGRLRDSFRRRDTKRQDMERYDVRNVIADRQPRSYKDKYGRDTSRPRSRSLTRRRRSKSGSVSPGKRRSHSRPPRRSPSPRPRRRSPNRRSSYSPANRKRSRSPLVRDRSPHKSRLMMNGKSSNHSARSQSPRPRLSRSPSPRDKNRKKSLKRKTKKRKISPDPVDHHGKKSAAALDNDPSRSQSCDQGDKRTAWENNDKLSPWSRSISPALGENEPSSWTPPPGASGQQLTVILKNKEKRKKEKKQRKSEKRKESSGLREKRERRKRDKHGTGVSGQTGAGSSHQSTAPSKEVFASGDNILVSVSFKKDAANKTQQTTIVTLPPSKDQIVSKKQSSDVAPPSRRTKRTSTTATVRKHKKINLKPVAIIDLDRSPFKEITPSPKAIIVLTDSDREDDDSGRKTNLSANMIDTHTGIIDHGDDAHNIEQVSQPQSPAMDDFDIANSSGGPKTPPEPPVVKFSLPLKSKNKLRNVNNPLHDAIEEEQQLLIQQQQQQQQQQSSGHISEPDDDDNANDMEPGECSEPMAAVQLNKVGPNTPPGPRSPDAYDPFEPTKSGSVSPDHNADHQGHSSSGEGDDNDDRTESHTPDLPPIMNNDVDKQLNNDKTVKPVDLTLALINSKASLDAANSFLSSSLEGGVDACENPAIQCIDDDDDFDDDVQIVSSTTGKEKQPIQVLSNVRLTNSSRVPTGCQGVGVTYLTKAALKATTSSPLKTSKGSGLGLLTKLPLPKQIGGKPSASTSRHNGGNTSMDTDGGADNNTTGHESPYSPDSSDYDDLFEPPPASPSQSQSQKKGGTSKPKAAYDDLFATSTSPIAKFGRNKKTRTRKPATATKGTKPVPTIPNQSATNAPSRLTEDQMRLFDEVPNSAVDMLVQDKYLRKLNRQERVVEEVKLVLKPHYYKNRISKEDYKDILRRSVPKICHNRSGEINPQKIKILVEAYVKKFRHRRKPVGAPALDG